MSLVLAALGKYSAAMQQASLGGSEFVERASNVLDNESAFKMLSRSASSTCSHGLHASTGFLRCTHHLRRVLVQTFWEYAGAGAVISLYRGYGRLSYTAGGPCSDCRMTLQAVSSSRDHGESSRREGNRL